MESFSFTVSPTVLWGIGTFAVTSLVMALVLKMPVGGSHKHKFDSVDWGCILSVATIVCLVGVAVSAVVQKHERLEAKKDAEQAEFHRERADEAEERRVVKEKWQRAHDQMVSDIPQEWVAICEYLYHERLPLFSKIKLVNELTDMPMLTINQHWHIGVSSAPISFGRNGIAEYNEERQEFEKSLMKFVDIMASDCLSLYEAELEAEKEIQLASNE